MGIPTPTECERCGRLFTAYRDGAAYCSGACKQAAHQARRRLAVELLGQLTTAIREHDADAVARTARRSETLLRTKR